MPTEIANPTMPHAATVAGHGAEAHTAATRMTAAARSCFNYAATRSSTCPPSPVTMAAPTSEAAPTITAMTTSAAPGPRCRGRCRHERRRSSCCPSSGYLLACRDPLRLVPKETPRSYGGWAPRTSDRDAALLAATMPASSRGGAGRPGRGSRCPSAEIVGASTRVPPSGAMPASRDGKDAGFTGR